MLSKQSDRLFFNGEVISTVSSRAAQASEFVPELGERLTEKDVRYSILFVEPNILIVIDNDSSIQMMAELIAAAFSQSRIVKADSFVGSDLLDAHIYFFGCKEPSPFSFNHVEKVLQHVNLAGRSCGIFSLDSEQAIAYLKRILLDSELTVYPQAFLSDSMENLEAWASRIVNVQGNDNV